MVYVKDIIIKQNETRKLSINKRETTMAENSQNKWQERRKSVVDRRLGLDRRRGPGRRLTEERKSAEEGQMSQEQEEQPQEI